MGGLLSKNKKKAANNQNSPNASKDKNAAPPPADKPNEIVPEKKEVAKEVAKPKEEEKPVVKEVITPEKEERQRKDSSPQEDVEERDEEKRKPEFIEPKKERPKKKKENPEVVKKPKPTMQEIRDTIPGPVMDKILKRKVKSAAQLNSAEAGSTSKLHKFSTLVPIETALEWVADQGSVDAVIVLDDESTVHIKDAVFEEFEDMSDD